MILGNRPHSVTNIETALGLDAVTHIDLLLLLYGFAFWNATMHPNKNTEKFYKCKVFIGKKKLPVILEIMVTNIISVHTNNYKVINCLLKYTNAKTKKTINEYYISEQTETEIYNKLKLVLQSMQY